MKTNKFSLLLVCLMILGFFFTSCGGGKYDLVGRWYRIEGSGSSIPQEIELLKDGTGFALKQAITWKTENKRLYITHPFLAMTFDYKLTGSKVELSNDKGQKFVYVKKFGGVPALAGTWETVSNKGESGETKQIIILNKDGTREDTVYINGEKVVESKSKWIAENNLLYMLQDDVEFVWKVTFEIKGRTLKITPGNTNLPEVEYIKK